MEFVDYLLQWSVAPITVFKCVQSKLHAVTSVLLYRCQQFTFFSFFSWSDLCSVSLPYRSDFIGI